MIKSVSKELPLDMAIVDAAVGVKKNDGRTPVLIEEHVPQGEGDVHYCLITYDDGSSLKVCRPDLVEYARDKIICETCLGSGLVMQESGAGKNCTANCGLVTCPDCKGEGLV